MVWFQWIYLFVPFHFGNMCVKQREKSKDGIESRSRNMLDSNGKPPQSCRCMRARPCIRCVAVCVVTSERTTHRQNAAKWRNISCWMKQIHTKNNHRKIKLNEILNEKFIVSKFHWVFKMKGNWVILRENPMNIRYVMIDRIDGAGVLYTWRGVHHTKVYSIASFSAIRFSYIFCVSSLTFTSHTKCSQNVHSMKVQHKQPIQCDGVIYCTDGNIMNAISTKWAYFALFLHLPIDLFRDFDVCHIYTQR